MTVLSSRIISRFRDINWLVRSLDIYALNSSCGAVWRVSCSLHTAEHLLLSGEDNHSRTGLSFASDTSREAYFQAPVGGMSNVYHLPDATSNNGCRECDKEMAYFSYVFLEF